MFIELFQIFNGETSKLCCTFVHRMNTLHSTYAMSLSQLYPYLAVAAQILIIVKVEHLHIQVYSILQ